MQKRNLSVTPQQRRKNDEDWQKLIVNCITTDIRDPEEKWGWGCLNRNLELFQIANIEKVKVPKRVVRELEKLGVIQLSEDGFYKYTKGEPRLPKRRVLA